jgi:hypothetical protein
MLLVLGLSCGTGEGGLTATPAVVRTPLASPAPSASARPIVVQEQGLPGSFQANEPLNLEVELVDEGVEVIWASIRPNREFVVMRREVDSTEDWSELAVIDATDEDGNLRTSFDYLDRTVQPGRAYVYGVRARNLNQTGDVLESKIVETDPVMVP